MYITALHRLHLLPHTLFSLPVIKLSPSSVSGLEPTADLSGGENCFLVVVLDGLGSVDGLSKVDDPVNSTSVTRAEVFIDRVTVVVMTVVAFVVLAVVVVVAGTVVFGIISANIAYLV